ncbi:MAG: sugar phosphate isomerase/epimerase, partial [Clostridia bacterium]|nr:sugar phosphate isomerase/epimerase [Clostridia bacterium]
QKLLNIAFDAASAMGNKQIVVHCDDYPIPKDGIYDSKVATEETYEFWAPFAEKAANSGLIMAIETVFHDNRSKDAPPDRFTTDLGELMGLIDRFDNPYVKCCWDSGHARLAFTRAGLSDAMRALGDRICCTHIHDNYYNKDLHVLPFQGDIDWHEHMATMKEIGYKGNLTYEIVYGKWPDELVEDFLSISAKTGKKLIEMFENA